MFIAVIGLVVFNVMNIILGVILSKILLIVASILFLYEDKYLNADKIKLCKISGLAIFLTILEYINIKCLKIDYLDNLFVVINVFLFGYMFVFFIKHFDNLQ